MGATTVVVRIYTYLYCITNERREFFYDVFSSILTKTEWDGTGVPSGLSLVTKFPCVHVVVVVKTKHRCGVLGMCRR